MAAITKARAARCPGSFFLGIMLLGLLAFPTLSRGSCSINLGRLGKIARGVVSAPGEWANPKSARQFSPEAFHEAQGRYQRLLESGNYSPIDAPVTLEEKVAFLDAVRSKVAPKEAPLLSDDVIKSFLAKRRLAHAFAGVDFKKGLTQAEVEELMSQLYLAGHFDPKGFMSLVKNGWSGSVKEVVRKRFEDLIAQRGIVPALAELGMMRAPGGWEKVKPYLSVLFTGLAIAATVYAKPHLPVYLPKAEFLRRQETLDKIYQKVMEKGFDAAYPDLFEFTGRPANFGLVFAHMRAAFMGAVFAYIVQSVWMNSMKRTKKKKAAAIKRDNRNQAELMTIASRDLGTPFETAAMENWKKTYISRFHHPPSPEEEQIIQSVLPH